jgi:hypothetical protein
MSFRLRANVHVIKVRGRVNDTACNDTTCNDTTCNDTTCNDTTCNDTTCNDTGPFLEASEPLTIFFKTYEDANVWTATLPTFEDKDGESYNVVRPGVSRSLVS